ncbi:polyprotein [Murine norovirus GV/WU20/2005/USA]|uniref:Polyprotein n=1 Tax=Murine norovirus GV/WU20/2005/USA TaxID=463711 RepID=A7YJZ7_NORV|nr:polyprotein [Murine norovirus GV/WU20/2005/USA]
MRMATPSSASSVRNTEKRKSKKASSKTSVSFGAPSLLSSESEDEVNYLTPPEQEAQPGTLAALHADGPHAGLPVTRGDARVLIFNEWEERKKSEPWLRLDMSDKAIFRRYPHLRPKEDKADAPSHAEDAMDAKEPVVGSILEQDDHKFYHYSVYIGNGMVMGVNNPGAAVCQAVIDVEKLHLWWRPVWEPRQPLDPAELRKCVGMTVPYVATTVNCYQVCCWIVGIKDTWLKRAKISRDSPFYSPAQDWNVDPQEPFIPSKLRMVSDGILVALSTVIGRPIKNLLASVKPLNILNIVLSCDWTFSGIVNALILLAELFDIFWTPPDVTNWMISIFGEWQAEGPFDLALDVVPTLLGGIGMAFGLTSETIGRRLASTNSALKAAQEMGKFAIEVFKQIMAWIWPSEDPVPALLSNMEQAVIKNECQLENQLTAMLRDRSAGAEFMKALDEEEQEVRKIAAKCGNSATTGTTNALLARISMARAAFEKARAEQTSRVRPVVIMVSGRPGIGKTYFCQNLAKRIAASLGDETSVGIIPRADVDHWDAYKGARVVLWDDFGMDNVVKDALRLQMLADTCPVTLNCDRIENKGKMFDSQVIIITTNQQTPVPLDYVNLEAVCRRIDFLVYAESPVVDAARARSPGDVAAVKAAMRPDYSHINFILAPQGGFDRQGNTPYGKGVTKTIGATALCARAVALVHERHDDFGLQNKVYDFDAGKVTAFKAMAADAGIPWYKMAAIGCRAMSCTCVEEAMNLLKDYEVAPCQVIYNGATYNVSCTKGAPMVERVKEPDLPKTLVNCVRRIKEARLRCYCRMATDVITSILQAAGTAFSIYHQIEKKTRPSFYWDHGYTYRDGPGAFDLFEDDNDGWYHSEGKKGKNKKGRGRPGVFKSRGLTDEEYDEFKKRRESKGGKYSIDDYLADREREEELQERDEEEAIFGDGFGLKATRRSRKAERARLGLVSGGDIRARKPIDWNVVGPSWADDDRQVDYGEKISFEAPVSIWSRVVQFGTGWGFWVSGHVFITAKHVAPPKGTEVFGRKPEDFTVTSSGDFLKYHFTAAVRPDIPAMVLENGCQEGVVASVLVKRASGEMLALAVRMGSQAAIKIGNAVVHGQTGMLLTGSNAKAQDLGTIPGDCGCPYVYKKGNTWVVIGVHVAATRSGNTVIAATHGEPTLEALEFQGPPMLPRPSGTYAGLPIADYGDAPPLSTKTMFWRTSPEKLPPGAWEPAYLGSKDERVDGPSLQQVMRDQLKPYSEPRGLLPPQEILDAVCDAIENRLENTLEPQKPWTFKKACESLDKNTSSGYPYHKQKSKDWTGTAFIGELGDQATHANNMYEMGKSMRPVYTAALKDELVKPDKIYQKIKKRLLWGSDLGTMIRAARAFGPFCDALKETCIFNPIRVGMSMNEDGPFIFARHANFRYHMDADYSRWDSTQQRAILKRAGDIMVRLSPEPDLARVVMDDLLAPSLLDVGDYKIVVEEGLPSGCPCTTQLNSMAHWILTLCAMVEVTRIDPDIVMQESEFSFYGDDEVVSTNLELDMTKYTMVLKRYGLLPTRADKEEGPLERRQTLQGISFLRRAIVGDQFGWYGRLDRASIDRQLLWTKGPNHQNPFETLPGHAQRPSQLMALLGEAAMHGEKYYRTVASRVSKEAAHSGIEMVVPRHRSVLRWVRFGTMDAETPQERSAVFVNEDE